jgi:hypothetical protein
VRTLVAFACALAALTLSTSTAAATVFGVSDEAPKYAPDGGAAFFQELQGAGLHETSVIVHWDPQNPASVSEGVYLDRVANQAVASGVRLVFVIIPTKANGFTTQPSSDLPFLSFLQILAERYPQVREFAIGNEPNQPRFWQPQYAANGAPMAGAAYETLLAGSYDALKSLDKRIRVIGLGISERGNDNPKAKNNISTSPIRFIHDVGAAYRASGRLRPIMDEVAFHPYPASSTDPLLKGFAWPNAGIANLDRIKQSIWDAFHGTAQATFEQGLTMRLLEVGWQATVPQQFLGAYSGSENVATTDEASQAAIYAQLIRYVACDPAVSDVLFFHLVDESRLEGFQTGLLRADGSARPSYGAVQQTLAQTGGRCAGTPVAWRHATAVVGGTALFRRSGASFRVEMSAQEQTSFVAGLVRLPAKGKPTGRQIARGLVASTLPVVQGKINAYWRTTATIPISGQRPPGRYAVALVLRASLNPARTSVFLGPTVPSFAIVPGR